MELQELITRIDLLKAELDAFGPLPKDAMERLEQKIRMEWNYHSNVMEGNSLTYGETRSLLLWGITARGKPLKDHLDLEGHNEAVKKLETIAKKDIDITENLIKEFHKLILAEPFDSYRTDIDVGKYKRRGNYLYNERGERVDFCPPEEVAEKLNALINWTNNAINPPKRKKKEYDIHPLLIATGFHIEFIAIHPFDDGNGRLARIFMNLILMQCSYPPIIIPLKDREQYYRTLDEAREQGIEPLAEYLGERLIASLELYLKAAKGESIEEKDDLDKEIALWKKKLEGSNAEVMPKSDERIYELYQGSFRPLFELFIDKMNQFDDLFAEKNMNTLVLINNSWRSGSDLKFIDSELDKWTKPIDNDTHKIEKGDLNSLTLNIQFRGFNKDGTNTFDRYPSLSIEFIQYKYKVSFNNKEVKECLYSEEIDTDMAQSVVNECVKKTFEEIKSMTKANINP